MSAPKNAITVREESKQWIGGDKDGLVDKPVESHCGFSGTLGDLLCDPDDSNPPANDFWCPQCESRDWYFS